MRKRYLDNIRWITQVFVVLYHVFYMYNGEGVQGGLGKITGLPVQHYDIVLYAIYPWLMMVLFIVSGIASRLYLERHADKEFFRSRTTKLLVPVTIGLFVFQFLQGYVNMALGDAFTSMQQLPPVAKYLIMCLSGIGVLWYLQILWVFSVLLLLVRKIEKDRLWRLGARTNIVALLALGAVVWASAQVLNTPVIIVYRFGLYGVLFFLGYFVFSHDEVMAAVKKYFPLFLLLAAGLGVAFCVLYFGQNFAAEPINKSPLFVLYGWFASIAILGGMARHADFENGFTRWMSKRSWGLYIFHYLGISSVALFLAKPRLLPAPAVYVLSALAGFAAGYLLQAIIARLPFFRWAVLGIKKPRATKASA